MKTTSCYFVGYAEKSKGFKFYCPNAFTRIVESNNAKFLEDCGALLSHSRNSYEFEEINDASQIIEHTNIEILIPMPLVNSQPSSIAFLPLSPTNAVPNLEIVADSLQPTTSFSISI